VDVLKHFLNDNLPLMFRLKIVLIAVCRTENAIDRKYVSASPTLTKFYKIAPEMPSFMQFIA